jgi:uncharacterized membrane protein
VAAMPRDETHPGVESARDQSREVARIAAFSDGVFAIAITLLALQLEVPTGDVDVWAELGRLQPNFLSFAISFAVIGAYWAGHHRLFALAGFANTGLAAYALLGHRLCADDVADDRVKYYIWRGLVIGLVFLVSLVLLPLGTTVVSLSWLSLIVFQRIVRYRFARSGDV